MRAKLTCWSVTVGVMSDGLTDPDTKLNPVGSVSVTEPTP